MAKNEISEQLKLARKLDTELRAKCSNYMGGLGSTSSIEPTTFIPSGIFSLDYVLGGGWPVGKIVEIAGETSVGKTTLMKQCVSLLQAKGYMAAWLDHEKSFEVGYARMMGMKMDQIAMFRPDTGEEGMDSLITLLDSGLVKIVVIDSVANMIGAVEMEKGSADATVAQLARLLSKKLPQVVNAANKTGAIVVLINQYRTKVGSYGAPVGSTGGKALAYNAAIQLRLGRGDLLKQRGVITGMTITVKNTKNRVAIPFREAELDLLLPYTGPNGDLLAGVDLVGDIVRQAVKTGIVTRSGAFYTLPDGSKFQGLAAVRAGINQSMLDSIYSQLSEYDKQDSAAGDDTEETTNDEHV
jgi:recombination protein RecA